MHNVGRFIAVFFLGLSMRVWADEIHPEGEAKATSGPLQLILRIYKKTIGAKEPLRVQIEIKNIGKKKKIRVYERMFYAPGRIETNPYTGEPEIYLEATDLAGKLISTPIPGGTSHTFDDEEHVRYNRSPGAKEETMKADAMVEAWKKEGLSMHEIDLKLLEYSNESARKKGDYEKQDLWLLPGASLRTEGFAIRTMEMEDANIIPKPIGDFTDVRAFEVSEPGKYRIRAVYDRLITAALRKNAKKSGVELPPNTTENGNFRVKTPWIELILLPKTREENLEDLRMYEQLLEDDRKGGFANNVKRDLGEIEKLRKKIENQK